MMQICPDCRGTGEARPKMYPWEHSLGFGGQTKPCRICHGNGWTGSTVKCSRCRGTGKITLWGAKGSFKEDCPNCDGTGSQD